jgi:hypothetical protein
MTLIQLKNFEIEYYRIQEIDNKFKLINYFSNMDIKHILWGCLLSIACVLLMGCPKECVNVTHSFTGKFSYNPEKKQHVIGDTLWLTSSFSCKSQINLVTGKYEAFCGANNLGTTLNILTLDVNGINDVKYAVDSFRFLSVKGKIYSGGTEIQKQFVKQLSFDQIDTNYVFKCGIIPLKKGKYYLGIGNAANVKRNISGDCEKANYTFTVSNAENNIDIYYAFRGNIDISDYEKQRGYWFEVK